MGEDIACEYLRDKKYKILNRNYRRPWGEIDIIARAYNQTLVFVEVKTLHSTDDSKTQLVPEDNLTRDKLEKLHRTCTLYVGKYPEAVSEKKGWRLDLVAISLNSTDDDDLPGKDKYSIRHYENIF